MEREDSCPRTATGTSRTDTSVPVWDLPPSRWPTCLYPDLPVYTVSKWVGSGKRNFTRYSRLIWTYRNSVIWTRETIHRIESRSANLVINNLLTDLVASERLKWTTEVMVSQFSPPPVVTLSKWLVDGAWPFVSGPWKDTTNPQKLKRVDFRGTPDFTTEWRDNYLKRDGRVSLVWTFLQCFVRRTFSVRSTLLRFNKTILSRTHFVFTVEYLTPSNTGCSIVSQDGWIITIWMKVSIIDTVKYGLEDYNLFKKTLRTRCYYPPKQTNNLKTPHIIDPHY